VNFGMQYVHKPTRVHALQWLEFNEKGMIDWLKPIPFHALDPEDAEEAGYPKCTAELLVSANSVWVPIETGEWVLIDERGAYPCKDDVFRQSYSQVGPS